VSPFEEALRRAVEPLLGRSERALVAVSGGRDSVALLHGLVRGGWTGLVVAHLDHGLRGAASTRDARFVTALAKRLGLESVCGTVDVAARVKAGEGSTEAVARELRYRFLATEARRLETRNVVLGHHAEDQVETCLLNLFRGSGLAGLSGMHVERRREVLLGAETVTLRLLRPMLALRREMIDAYLREHRFRFREDATNASTGPTRNAIRLELLPLIRKTMGREVDEAILRSATIARDEEAWLASLLPAPGPGPLLLAELRREPVAWQRRRLQAWLAVSGVPGIGFREVERVRSLYREGEEPPDGTLPAKVNLPGGWHARRREKRLFLEPPGEG